ncbi:putative Ig domain-containing protein [Nitratireductor sp. ZSWI3]|uniref:putative Ig domain-containing protein n=1 Tax=Nitratireductor sp. ZSWI3 TaxID=2966359 RepID=UPI00214FC5B9|nr:Ig-like domain repeat protein [Nitratireductor sp. ZSWI3]MCR4268815.1 Ig-like domain repeat protein [Nitratireductor sp. ZSWI3]
MTAVALITLQMPALAQQLSIAANPSTFNAAGDTINFTYTIQPGSYTITSINTPITTAIKNVNVTCPAVPPGGTSSNIVCTGAYVVSTEDATSGTFADFVQIRGLRVGGTFDFTSPTLFVTSDAGGEVNISVNSSPRPSQPGETVSVTATVSSLGCNAGDAPPGTVTISVGAESQTLSLTWTAPVSPSSSATMQVSTLPVGTHPVSASYSGGGGCAAATASGADHPVDTPPTVTINQAAGQSDPTAASSILFDVVFDKNVTGFTSSDVALSGTAGAVSASVSGSGSAYTVAVSGMTQPGTVSATVPAGSATSTAGFQNQASTSTDNTVTYVVLEILPATLPDPVYNTPYLPPQLTASGGTGPYGFSIDSGDLPAGITLSGNGQLSGTATATGSFSFTVAVTDQNGLSATQSYTLNIAAPVITIAPPVLPEASYGMPYNASLTASGGADPYLFSLDAGALPVGLSMSSSGVLSGTPSQAGTFVFTVRAEDQYGLSATAAFSITVDAPEIDVQPAAVPQPAYGVAYEQQLSGSGGTPPYLFSLASGSLPPGLALSSAGRLSGTAIQPGTFNISIRVEDANGYTGTRAYTLIVAAPTIALSPPSLPAITVGAPVAQQFSASGGSAPYLYSLVSGALPAGIALSSAGLLSGQATATGTFGFSVQAADVNGNTGETAYTLTVSPSATTTTLQTSASPSTVGDMVTFTASVTSSSGNPLSGTVVFTIDGAGQPPVAVSGGSASLSTSTLAVGTHTITAAYSGDPGNAASTSAPLTQAVEQAVTTTSVISSSNPSDYGDPVTFTATVSGVPSAPAPTGSVQFSSNGALLGTVALAGTTAAITVSDLAAGGNDVVATYGGDANNVASTSPVLVQTVRALGTVIIRQITTGGDGTFSFTSSEPALNVTVTTVDGEGASMPLSLTAGTYAVSVGVVEGFAVTSISCNDGDSFGSVETRTATISLAAEETVICTFSSANSRDVTSDLLAEFVEVRAGMILENQPDMGRRVGRLNGQAGGGGSISSLLGYLPQLADARSVNLASSLGAIRRLSGGEGTDRFDLWFEGSYSRFEANEATGHFGLATIGADYLVNRNLLVGAFLQVDRTTGFVSMAGGTAEGTGWLAGPYLTARLSENLYFDLLAGAGTSSNDVNPLGTYTDSVDATRWLVSAAVQGAWQRDAWTFSPRARLAYFEERTEAYTDSLGVDIPAVKAGLGQISFGPGLSYRHITQDDVLLDFSIRLDGVMDIRNTQDKHGLDNFHGRVEAAVDASLPGGGRLGVSAHYSGLGESAPSMLGGRVRLSMPLN